MQKTIALLSIVIIFMACSNNKKRVVVFYKGSFSQEKNKLNIVGQKGHLEKDFILASSTENLILEGNYNTTSTLNSAGLYVVNAKPDTIVGAYQVYAKPKSENTSLTIAFVEKQIDSLQQLIQGKNITATNRNFYILPGQVIKISDNAHATVVGPFHKMTSIAVEKGQEPEVYRFYHLSEIRELIEKLQQEITK
jgi:hypothetical protein